MRDSTAQHGMAQHSTIKFGVESGPLCKWVNPGVLACAMIICMQQLH
jgi:hypothetical protein